MYLWTNEEIEKILIQLNEREEPFQRYSFAGRGGKLLLLGKGGSALVYEAKDRAGGRGEYAIKVIGFGEEHVDFAFFEHSVKTQKDTGLFQKNIVKIYDYVEKCVWIDEENRVVGVRESAEETGVANCLRLQFILMEKLEPVLRRDKSGRAELFPEHVAGGDEKEILKLAYDIGKALSLAHQQNILHRDVKLENIFYDKKGKCYKLGDFGIAKMTDDGMASTVAFTKGYGAPEVVGSLKDKYDNTADIYSFGVLLYVLVNDLKFPDSDYYHVNSRMQYRQGYVLPRPVRCPEGLWPVIEKMCRYDPDERYQSVDEVLDALEKLIFHADTHYRREHRKAPYAVGALLLILGAAVWKLTFKPEAAMELSKEMYLFLALAVGKWGLRLLKKNTAVISGIILGVGIWLMVSFGFSWGKLLFLLCMVCCSGDFAGLSAGAVFSANAAYFAAGQNRIPPENCQDYRWVAVTLLSLAALMLLEYMVLQERDRTLARIYLKKDRYWIMVFFFYAAFFLYGLVTHGKTADMCGGFLGERLTAELLSWDLGKVGGAGMAVSMAWFVREKVLIREKERGKDRAL